MNVKVCLDAPTLTRWGGGTVVQSQHPDIPKDAQVVFVDEALAEPGAFLLFEDRRFPALLVYSDSSDPPHIIVEVPLGALRP